MAPKYGSEAMFTLGDGPPIKGELLEVNELTPERTVFGMPMVSMGERNQNGDTFTKPDYGSLMPMSGPPRFGNLRAYCRTVRIPLTEEQFRRIMTRLRAEPANRRMRRSAVMSPRWLWLQSEHNRRVQVREIRRQMVEYERPPEDYP